MSDARPQITGWTKFFYGFGAVAYGVKDNGFSFFLLLYYNQVLGLPQAWVGPGIMVALVIDAISDPIVGHLSDNLHSRFGRRHPFMYAAAVPVGLSYFLLFSPPTGLEGGGLFAYFVVVAVLVRTSITFYEIPSTSLVAELTDDYDERTSMMSYRLLFAWWGGLLMSVFAYTVFLRATPEYPVGVLNPAGYHGYGVVSGILMVTSILTCSIGTHRHIPYLKKPPEKRPFELRRTIGEVFETLRNRNFLSLFVSGLFAAMGAGLSAALNIYFNTYFWELDSDQISRLVITLFFAAGLAQATTPRISLRLGKKRAAVLIAGLGCVLSPLTIVLRLLGWFPENGSPFLLPTLIAFTALEVTLIIGWSILVTSMVADVVEESELRTGRRSEGLFFAARSFMQKAVSGIGVVTSTAILTLVGFPADAQPGAVDPTVVRNLGIAYSPTIVTLYLLAVAGLAGYRIDRTSHEATLRELSDRGE